MQQSCESPGLVISKEEERLRGIVDETEQVTRYRQALEAQQVGYQEFLQKLEKKVDEQMSTIEKLTDLLNEKKEKKEQK